MDKEIFDSITPKFDFDKYKSIESLCTYLSQGVNIDSKNSSGNTLLHEAVINQNDEILKFLIDSGADVSLKNNMDETALNISLNSPRSTAHNIIMKMLIMAGADVNTKRTDNNMTALHEAAAIGDIDLVKFLINSGADVNATKSDDKWKPLHYAAHNIFFENPIEIFEVLLLAGADINAETSGGETPLHLLTRCELVKPVSLVEIVKIFSDYGADFYAKDQDGQTPMDTAAQLSNTEAVKALVLVGKVDANSKFHVNGSYLNDGKYILHEACYRIDIPTIKFLLKNGANINALDFDKISPLQQVVNSLLYDRGDEELMKKIDLLDCLLKRNPDVNIITAEGHNILTPFSDYDLPDYLWKIIIAHLAKLQVTYNLLHDSLLDIIFNKPAFRDYFEICTQELKIAKINQVHEDSWVTFFNLLVDDKRKLARYAGNVNLVMNLRKDNLIEKFSNYGALIYLRFSKAVQSRQSWEQAAETLSDLLHNHIDPTHRVIINILKFFNSKDLQNLSKMTENY